MTLTERLVWSRLRERQIGGFKFRRQFPIGQYFADFACLSERLVVEIDGETHDQERDARRDAFLQSLGFRVMRLSVTDVDEGLEDVLDGIYSELTEPYSVLERHIASQRSYLIQHPHRRFAPPPRRAGRG